MQIWKGQTTLRVHRGPIEEQDIGAGSTTRMIDESAQVTLIVRTGARTHLEASRDHRNKVRMKGTVSRYDMYWFGFRSYVTVESSDNDSACCF